jgi:ankyrin repeat protein
MKLCLPMLMLLTGCGMMGLSDADIWAASQSDNVEAIEKFLAEGVQVDATDESGGTPLHAAARGNATKAIALLASRGANPHARNGAGVTPLVVAVTSDQDEAVVALLDNGASPNEGGGGRSPLSYAIAFENKVIEEILRSRGARE